MILSAWSHGFFKKCIPVCKLCTVLLPNLLGANVNFIARVRVEISSKKMHTRFAVNLRLRHVTAFMTLSKDPIYQKVPST